jgi:hypothetical protein
MTHPTQTVYSLFQMTSETHMVHTHDPNNIYIIYLSEFLVTDPEAWVRFPALPEKK